MPAFKFDASELTMNGKGLCAWGGLDRRRESPTVTTADMNADRDLLGLAPSAGHVDRLSVENNRVTARGWMFVPGRTFQRIDAYVDGRPAGTVLAVSRPDVDEAYAWARPWRPTGFEFAFTFDAAPPDRVDLVGRVKRKPGARMSFLLPRLTDESRPQPPDRLADRVSGLHGPAFRAQGLRMFTDLVDQMTRIGIPANGRILDWGCGCGRVAHYFRARLPEARLLGCDIDEEAIDWCRQNLGPDFIRVDPAPPTPFDGGSVDVIIACSVLTHLTEAGQDQWLKEMRRILAPGGYFLASTNGEFMYQLQNPEERPNRLWSLWRRIAGPGPARLTGINDSRPDPALDGIAPPGYYRAVFQSREHTVNTCSKYFHVIDYVERGLNGHQDLVILQRPK